MTDPTPSAQAVDIRLLEGEWRGTGIADFPTIERVQYNEVLTVTWDAARAVLVYEQVVELEDGSASHRETGFIRSSEDGAAELWNAQDNGRTEVLRGSIQAGENGEVVFDLASVAFGNDPRMLSSRRQLWVGPNQLRYQLEMATTTAPDAQVRTHLQAELSRQG